jgi:prepilin-type N-terminal cleavage/methylation domain-containing protein
MNTNKTNTSQGFSLIELLVSMSIVLIMLGAVGGLLSGSLQTRSKENQRTDTLAASQRVINLMSREISNSGFGLTTNGIVTADSNATAVHFRANTDNSDLNTNDLGEDVTYKFDSANKRIIRYDAYPTATTSILASGVTDMVINYRDYTQNTDGSVTVGAYSATPSVNTSRVKITIQLALDRVNGQAAETTSLSTEISLRNSKFVLDKF